MGLNTYYYDTYALLEIVFGNPNYDGYTVDFGVVTTRLNLMEVYYFMLRKYSREVANKYYDRLLPQVIEIIDDDFKNACELKSMFKKKKLSYIDCVGYSIAKRMNLKFLTGDREFEDLDNVEFVK